MKIGIVGLGDIARKAYLPVIHHKNVELHLHTRRESTLHAVGDEYRIPNRHHLLDSLISSGVTGAFVHAPTDAHEYLIEHLLSGGIHVHVDKPVTYDYASTARLMGLAEKKNLLLQVGFNRRYAPSYNALREVKDPNMIIMQKNRRNLPGEVRKFVFDDFIHVIDTLLWLFPHTVEHINISGRKKKGLLYHAMITLTSAEGAVAVGIMNRDAGTVEETVEVFGPLEKRMVRNFSDVITYKTDREIRTGSMDWETTLHRRGFEQMIDVFLEVLKSPNPANHKSDTLLTHRICEQVVKSLESYPASAGASTLLAT